MRWLYFSIICLACLIALGGCGSWRPSSINRNDDHAFQTKKSYDSLNIKNGELNFQVRKQSFDLESGGYQQTDATGWKPGLIINNRLSRVIRYDIYDSMDKNHLVASYRVGDNRRHGPHSVPIKLPMGTFEVVITEYKVKNNTISKKIIIVGNQAKIFDNNNPYFFIISNE